jgi:hypothetical protein
MGKRIFISVLWGMTAWTWISMAHVVMGFPDFGLLAGFATAAGFILRGRSVLATRPIAVDQGQTLST